MEDKQKSLSAFAEFLKTTRYGKNIVDIQYEKRSLNAEHPEWFDEYAVIIRSGKNPIEICINGESCVAAASTIIEVMFL